MNFPSFEGIASMHHFLCIFCQEFVLTLSNYELLFDRLHSIQGEEGICTGIFISGFRSARAVYETLPNPTRIFSSCLLSLFPLCRPNRKENSFHSNELGEGE